ncbi:hypothetical protein GCM10011506_42330 [Marivirga lumbricoides]|uniref:Transposase IS4-like domain-containing protein n=1 Tax=Marivirga lumbricoides TaxID=1046115 RepID=A0ABQ1N3K6_9BACT|nr:hypothetical protein GCM10011506_42330 [Marivirga lumbricoides]
MQLITYKKPDIRSQFSDLEAIILGITSEHMSLDSENWLFRKTRKSVESLFSQLCHQFMIRRNYTKTFRGFKTRILAKITVLTLLQFINKIDFDRQLIT